MGVQGHKQVHIPRGRMWNTGMKLVARTFAFIFHIPTSRERLLLKMQFLILSLFVASAGALYTAHHTCSSNSQCLSNDCAYGTLSYKTCQPAEPGGACQRVNGGCS